MAGFVRRHARNYATVAGFIAIATLLQAALVRAGGADMPLALYFPFIAAAVWATSLAGGIGATAASAVLIWVMFLSDTLAYPGPLSARIVQLATFVIVNCAICAIVAALKGSRRMNEALRRREALARRYYEALLQSLTQGVVVSDRRGVITYMNPAAATLIGCDATAVRGLPFRGVFRAYDGHGARVRATALDRVLRSGASATVDGHWLMPHDGQRVPIAEVASPLVDAAGGMTGAVLIVRDVSVDRERVAASQMLRRLVEASPDAIVGVGANRRITSWNPAARRMFSYDEQAALGRDVAMLIAPRWLRRHPLPASVPGVREPIENVDVLCMRQDGSRLRATLSASPVLDERDACVALSLTLRDTGGQRRRERRAHRSLRGARDARRQADTSNRLKDELLATVSHELRTPLNVIYGWIEVLRNPVDGALQQQAIDAIDRSARSLARMVGDILDASSLATGKLRLDAMPVDLVRIVNDVTGALGTAAQADGIELAVECALDTCIVSGDGERLRQMLSNLLSNAFKFTPRGGRVTVSLERTGSQAKLTVADTGQGISPEFLPHVFEAFRRAEGAPASSRRGLGLGLSIVRHIVELHGGKVGAASAGKNRGTTFAVTLPAGWQPIGALAWAVQMERGARMTLDAQRVLLVDDDATSRASLAAALKTLGAEVIVASSGREAIAKADALRPTVVLSDLAMPDGDGFWLLDALRHANAHAHAANDAPVLAVTAHAGREDERRVLAAGFDGYLCKPVDLQTLARAILRATGSG
ncbi:sensory box protein [Burkholderia thailandensis MSMB121]|uniref:hybrid sensor histidine kinase/response regulator n=3 Tax=Burkholderia humptydooensis TaxID=430531 RepID=UPI00032805FB|nr:ATP-binding protein [Burkholderia humptydooensis]AGK51726.1 sensory box protein [Burkholderia thailandensis MSMB121]ATF33659.1 hybrid sensor histidine kinase/response regulator [Burkholderia thailandensis]KST71739.1 hybrid sensor histidine kinase/response regulator [Burkholderia humptydooensis]